MFPSTEFEVVDDAGDTATDEETAEDDDDDDDDDVRLDKVCFLSSRSTRTTPSR